MCVFVFVCMCLFVCVLYVFVFVFVRARVRACVRAVVCVDLSAHGENDYVLEG